MPQEFINRQTIIITGGTSGLGIELVKQFLKNGNTVIALGRQIVEFPEYGNTFKLLQVDFSDLKQVAVVAKTICEEYDIDVIINNAGIFSPPDYKSTVDGLEYTFQVNFLSHLLINEIIIGRKNDCGQLTIVHVTSPVYRMPGAELMIQSGESGYNPFKAYSSSKLCLTQMCKFLDNRRAEFNLVCFSYDPGTFSSGIFRMQKKWFRTLYHIASPFMRSPGKVARVLSEIITRAEIENGMIYDVRKRSRSNPEIDENKRKAFIRACYEVIDPLIGPGYTPPLNITENVQS